MHYVFIKPSHPSKNPKHTHRRGKERKHRQHKNLERYQKQGAEGGLPNERNISFKKRYSVSYQTCK